MVYPPYFEKLSNISYWNHLQGTSEGTYVALNPNAGGYGGFGNLLLSFLGVQVIFL
jgi:hypothetical protein